MFVLFVQFCVLTILASMATALSIDPLTGATSQGTAKIVWHNDPSDSSNFNSFSIFMHHPSFQNDFAILNNVIPAAGSANVALPVLIPQDGYTLRATNVANINQVYAESSSFAIGTQVSTTGSSSSTTTTSATPTGSVSGTVRVGASASATSSSAAHSASATHFNAASRLGFDFDVMSIFMAALSAIVGGVIVAA